MPSPSPRAAAHIACVVLVSIAAASCAHRPAPAPADWRERLSGTARAARFDAERPPVVDDRVTPAEQRELPEMTFARVRDPRGDARVVGKITSKSAYPRLGIAPGENYVWLVAGKRPRIALVPADASRPAFWLAGGPHLGPGGDVCQTDPNFFQLSVEPGGSAQRDDASGPSAATNTAFVAIMATCVCVNGSWIHVGGSDEAITVANAGVLFQSR